MERNEYHQKKLYKKNKRGKKVCHCERKQKKKRKQHLLTDLTFCVLHETPFCLTFFYESEWMTHASPHLILCWMPFHIYLLIFLCICTPWKCVEKTHGQPKEKKNSRCILLYLRSCEARNNCKQTGTKKSI